MRKILLLASIVAFFASCSSKPKFELEVNITNNDSLINKQFVIAQKIDGKVVYSDTVKIKKKNFVLRIPKQGNTLLTTRVLESRVSDVIMAVDGEQSQLIIDGNKTYISGTPINDDLQAFYNGNDSVTSLIAQLSQEYKDDPALLRQKRNLIYKENTDRIIAFIKKNVDNPVGEYYFLTNYIMFPDARKEEMHSFASKKLKKELRLE